MALENILSEEIVQRLGWTLLHFVWQAAAVTLILGILLAFLRKSSANVRYLFACTALGLIVLLPIVTLKLVPVSMPQPVANIEPPPAPVITPAQPTVEETSPVVIVEHEQPAKLESIDTVPNISWKQRAVEQLEPALPYLVAGWLLGVFGLSLWHLGGWAQLQRLKKQMVKRVDVSLQTKMNELAVRLRVNQVVELVESALVQVPTVVGWLRPVILLPASAVTGLSTEQLEALLAHELAHIRRYDYLVNMLQTVVETLGFYHPAVWWISHRIRVERENCCDDVAVSISGDRIRYAKALTSMEEIRAGRSELAVAATGGNLFGRISRLVSKDSNESSRASWIPSAITILLIAIIVMPTTIALTTSQEPQQETDVMGNLKPESAEWQNIGELIPPDFNDTKVLIEHINLGSIGQDCEGKVFITCILDSAQSSVRRHRFVLVQKNGNILEPSGYMTFGPENKLQEKFSFNVPFSRREIEGFRFQSKPSPLTGIDDSLLQLQQGNFIAVEREKLVPSGLAPPGRYAIELDGIDDYLLVPDSPSLRLEKPFTVEMWIKTNLPADASKEYGDWVIISKGFYVGTPRAWVTGFGVVFQRYPEDPSKLLVDYVTANNSGTYSQTYGTRSVLTNGKSDWIHLYHVFDREKYKSAPGHPLVIGKYLIPTTRPLMGQIGEIRIWNSARTREQIRRYENDALTGNEPDLAAWWTFEQKQGQFAYDMSGNNNHARLGSTSGADDADPKWIDLEATPNQAERNTNTPVEGKSPDKNRQGLTLAIVPNVDPSGREPSLTNEEYQQYLNRLARSGPFVESVLGDRFQWFPVKGNIDRFKQLPLSIFKKQAYILLCTQAKYVMVPRIDGRQTWGIENVWISQDNNSRPAVSIQLDEKGAELFYELTKANIGNHLAMCVDGQVLSAPRIETALRKFVIITGNLNPQELLHWVENLQRRLVITRDTENKTQQKQLNDILEKFSDEKTADESGNDSKSVRESVENYIAAALAGEDEKAAEYTYPGTAVPAQTNDIREILQGQDIKIVAACIGEWDSMAITPIMKADHVRTGSIVFHLKKVTSDQKAQWLIDDIDFETLDTIGNEISYFLNNVPDAKMIIINPDTYINKQTDTPPENDKTLQTQKSESDELPAGWSLKYIDGSDTGGNLAVLKAVPKPIDENDESWKQEKLEFRVSSLEGSLIKTVLFTEKFQHNQVEAEPGKYLLKYERRWGESGDNYRIWREFPADLSRPGMYELQFTPKLGTAEITGTLGGCYSINFEKDDDGPWIRGFAYQYPSKQYTLDGLPPGKYSLSAVTMRGSPNVIVSQAKVTVGAEDKAIVNIVPVPAGNCSLKGNILGRQKNYKTPWPTWPESEGKWYVLIRKPGSGKIGKVEAYEALTMDSLYVVRGQNITQQTQDKASYHIEGLLAGEYTVTAIEHPSWGGCTILRQLSQTLVLKESDQAVLDFDLRDVPKDYTPAATETKNLIAGDEGSIEGRIIDIETGRGISGVQLAAVPHSSPSYYRLICTSEKDGKFAIGGLQSGEYLIRGEFPSVDVDVVSGRCTRDVLIGVNRRKTPLTMEEESIARSRYGNVQILIDASVFEIPADEVRDIFEPNESFSNGILMRNGHEIVYRLLALTHEHKEARLIASPQVITLSGHEASMSIGDNKSYTLTLGTNSTGASGSLMLRMQSLLTGNDISDRTLHLKLSVGQKEPVLEPDKDAKGYEDQASLPGRYFSIESTAKNNEPIIIGSLRPGRPALCVAITQSALVPERQPVSLIGKKLPEPDNIQNIDSFKKSEAKRILVCFWDMEQRPSRNFISELGKREKELAEKDITVHLVHTSKTEPAKLKEWLDSRNVPFISGSIKDNADDVLFRWGVRAQPWLILTDQNGLVSAEGFSLEQLDEKIEGNKELGFNNNSESSYTPTAQIHCTGKVVDEQSRPIANARVTLHVFVYGLTSSSFDTNREQEVMTGIDGAFSFNETSETEDYWAGYIVAEKQGMALGIGNWEPREGSKKLEIKLCQPKELAGMVVDESGQPVSSARVSISRLKIVEGEEKRSLFGSLAEELFKSTTDTSGKFAFTSLPANATAEFIIKKTGKGTVSTYRRTADGLEKLNFTPGQTGIKLVLPDEARIKGIAVEKQSGKPVAGVKLELNGAAHNRPYHETLESEDDGTFSIGSLTQGRYIMDLVPSTEALAEWAANPIEVPVETGKTESGVKIELSKGGVLEIVVTDAASKEPVEKAHVALVNTANSQHHYSASDKDGIARIRLMPGDYQISSLYKQDYLRQEPRDLVSVEDGKTKRFEYEFASMPKITGIVRDEQDNPIEGVKLGFLPGGLQDFTSNAEGKFVINWDSQRRGSGDINVYLVARHEQRNLAAIVELDGYVGTLDIKLKPGVILFGKVTDPEGKGIADAWIIPSLRLPMVAFSMGRPQKITDSEGNFEIKAMPAGYKYVISVSADGYGSKSSMEIQTDDTAADSRFDVGLITLPVANLSVSGVVVDVNGKPVQGVVVNGYDDIPQVDRTTFTDEDGKFTLEKVCAGPIHITADRGGAKPLSGSRTTRGGAKNVRIIVSQRPIATESEPKHMPPPSLIGKPLPEFQDIGISVRSDDIEDRKILLCFWDMEQRPSRNLIDELAKREKELNEKNIAVYLVHTSKTETAKLKELIDNRNIPFICGSIKDNAKDVLFRWGMQAQPWLILTDEEGIVRAEGFSLEQLDEKFQKKIGANQVVLKLVDPNSQPVVGARVGTYVDWSDIAENPPVWFLRYDRNYIADEVKSDEHGKVTLQADEIFGSGQPAKEIAPITAIDEGHYLVGLREMSRKDLGKEVTLMLQPGCRVHGRLTATAARKRKWSPKILTVYVHWYAHRPCGYSSKQGRFEFVLPPGKYQIQVYSDDPDKALILPILIKPGQRDLDLTKYLDGTSKPPAAEIEDLTDNDSSDESRQGRMSARNDMLPAKTAASSAGDKSIVRVDLSVIEMFSDSKMDRETIIEIKNLLGGKITIPDSPAVADLLKKAAKATAAVKDESAGDKRVTQMEFNTLFDLLVSRGYVKILMNPALEVVDGETAKITSSQKIPSRQEPLEDLIQITPHVSKDGNIILQVKAILSFKSARQDNEQTTIINTHEIATLIRLSPGESGIIGGTQQTGFITKPDKGVKDSEGPDTEILVILTPTIVDTTSNRFETRVFQLKYADPDMIKERIEGSYKYPANEPQETVSVIAFPTTKQVAVIASPENLSRIANQIAEWDTFQVFKPRIFKLQNSDPVQMARLLTTLFAEEGGDEVNIRDVILGKDIAGPLNSHFIFEDVPETSKIIVISNIPKAYETVGQLIIELDKQKMVTKDVKQVREWIARLVKEGRLGVPKTIDEAEQSEKQKKPMETVNFQNAEAKTVIETLAEWTGKTIISTDELMKQKITIYAPQPIPRSEAATMILNSLCSKGYTAEQNDDTIYLKPVTQEQPGTGKAQIQIDTKIMTASDEFLKAVGLDPNSLEGIGWWSENLVYNHGFGEQAEPIALTFDEHAVDLLLKAVQSRKDYRLLTHQKILATEGMQTGIPVVSQAYYIEVAYDPNKPSEAPTARTGKLQFGTFIRLTPELMPGTDKIAMDLEKEVRLLKDFDKDKYKGKHPEEIPPYSWSKTKVKIVISDGDTLPIVGQRIAEPVLLTEQEASQQKALWENMIPIRLAFRNSSSIEKPDRILILIKPKVPRK